MLTDIVAVAALQAFEDNRRSDCQDPQPDESMSYVMPLSAGTSKNDGVPRATPFRPGGNAEFEK
jgi:hypothetical protein